MNNKNKSIEIPFGAKDSELGGFEYTIPEGFEAVIENGKVKVRKTDSEDEKIRKALIEAFSRPPGPNCVNVFNGIPHRRILAWLEKQKHKTAKYNVGATIYYNSFGKITSMVVANVIDTGDGNPMYEDAEGSSVFESDLVEQKPVEWSEEDEEHIQSIEHTIRCMKAENVDRPDVIDVYVSDLNWLKSLRDRVQPQPKQEWSEEDEGVIKFLLTFFRKEQHATEESPIITWLKSLKERCIPQPNQEWSEEDKEIVDEILRGLTSCEDEWGGDWSRERNWLKSLRPQKLSNVERTLKLNK